MVVALAEGTGTLGAKVADWFSSRRRKWNRMWRLCRPEGPQTDDSITHRLGGEPNDKKDDVWHQYYEPRNAVNLGFGWDRTENVLWRLQHGELEGAGPRVAVIMIVTSKDIMGDFLHPTDHAGITGGRSGQAQ